MRERKINRKLLFFALTFAIGLCFLACQSNSEEEDLARLAEMKREILSLVRDAPAGDSTDCRYIGLGSKACGGPVEYLIYSIAGTDTALLMEMVREYNAFEEELNRKYGRASDCSLPPQPVLGVINGRCVDLRRP